MTRGTIIIEDNTVSVTGNEIWMTATEIAGLFHTGVPAVNAAIRAVRKPDVLNDYEVCRYMRLENGLHADVYSLEIIIPVAFRLNTYHAHVFRTLEGKAAGIRDVHTERKSRVLLKTQKTYNNKNKKETDSPVKELPVSFFFMQPPYSIGLR